MVSFPATNYIANIEKNDSNSDFHQMIDFLCCSPIHFAISHSPPMYKDLLTSFWQAAHISDHGRIKSKVLKKRLALDATTFNQILRLPPSKALFTNPSHDNL